jgi:hypothetical protein
MLSSAVVKLVYFMPRVAFESSSMTGKPHRSVPMRVSPDVASILDENMPARIKDTA